MKIAFPAAGIAVTEAVVTGGGVGQPSIVPACVAKMKRDATGLPPDITGKPVPPLKTVPVGPPGTPTTSACGVPSPVYSVEVFVPLFETHHGVAGPAEMPQPLIRCGSGLTVPPPVSETSGVTV